MTDEYVDVAVIGAGISGIGAAYHLRTMSPDRSFTLIEARHDIGGTWDLFRYPGVRSDSDMHTLGYRFKPWTSAKAIADGPSIMRYLRETVAEHDIERHIRFGHRLRHAAWDTDTSTWTLTIERTDPDTGATGTTSLRCNYLFMCAGYYSYARPHDAQIPGLAEFGGTVVHPQFWPEDLDYTGKRVVVIGSGATAMTIVPAMAADAARVTMLQRSPTYVVARPGEDAIANTLRKYLPDRLAYRITRKKNTTLQQLFYGRARKKPDEVKAKLLAMTAKALPDVDVDTHFTPTYNPWDQRLCLIPDGDLYDAINAGKADVVTDTIDTVTADGIRLSSGRTLDADIIVTATGLRMVTLGEADVTVDGEPIDFGQTWTYKGLAYSGVPNLATCFGYINASWTLRADLTSEYVCRLLNHMAETGTTQCTPQLRPGDHDMPARPFIENFSSGYMQRTMHEMPKQGDREPWLNPQSYARDRKMFRKGPIDDGVMRFTRPVPDDARPPGDRVVPVAGE
ncbi:MAG: flavin-containing monooxygenase [Desertimonas sp.]